MSVRELLLEDSPWKIKITSGEKTIFRISTELPANGAIFTLDRNQAHLLMLYLQEYLQPTLIMSKEPVPKELWECKCGNWHAKDFVCERI